MDGVAIGFITTGAVLTAASGGVLIWSGIDTLDAAADYDRMPTREKLNDGRDLELRTNILIGVTAGLGALTLAGLLFAIDWGGDDDVQPSVMLGPSSVAFSLRGPLP
jgi:hypothetical protein